MSETGGTSSGAFPVREPRLSVTLARTALAWEAVLPPLWPALGIAGVFGALALLDVLPILGGWGHAAVLAAAVAGFLGALGLGLCRIRLPDRSMARRRLERDSGLPHRPLSAAGDRPAFDPDDAVAAALWQVHQSRLQGRTAALRIRLPVSTLATADPRALRHLLALVLVAAAVGSRGDWGPRLATAFHPALLGPAIAAAPPVLDVWITPPAYTGQPPLVLHADAPAAIRVPMNAVVLARVAGGVGTPTLTLGDQRSPFERVDGAGYQLSKPVTSDGRIEVAQDGTVLGAWPVSVIPVRPPTVTLTAPPGATERGALKLIWHATDDYGLTGVTATLRPAPGMADALGPRGAISFPLPLPGANPRDAKGSTYRDLTAHPWAGRPVMLEVQATNGAGQTGTTGPIAITLPERPFKDPVARAIVAERKTLIAAPREARPRIATALVALAARPDAYRNDVVVFMALRSAALRLALDQRRGDPGEAAAQEVIALLWDTALRVENGQVPAAEQAVRDARQALRDALDRNAPEAEIAQLMGRLQQAMNQYMDALTQQTLDALAKGTPPGTQPPGADQTQVVERQDIQRMLDQLRAMTQAGARDAARDMLSQLDELMENLRGGGQPGGGQDNALAPLMDALQKLTGEQRQLLDQSFRDAQSRAGQGGPSRPYPGGRPGGQPAPGGQTGQQQVARQDALRRALGEIMRRLGEQQGGDIPAPLGRAERSMRDAERALGQNAPGAAVEPQAQALEGLQQGLQGLGEQMAQQMMMRQSGGRSGKTPDGRSLDPLGREPTGEGPMLSDGNEVHVPEQFELQKARAILEELRRRSGQIDRPKLEHDYINRLLDSF